MLIICTNYTEKCINNQTPVEAPTADVLVLRELEELFNV